MKRNVLLLLLLITALLKISAQEKNKSQWINNVRLSGYGMIQYQYSNQYLSKANSFNLRMARFSLDGRVMNDFYWKAQVQFNGNTSTLGSSPKVVDLFVEWQKYNCFRVKVGQFKNPFTFENPMNPIDQGFIGYGQAIMKLAGFTDRVGEHSSNGRDIGLQIQGDVLKNESGRDLIHYQLGVFNGQGINVKDVDQQKNIIGGLWVMPVKGMRIGAFGWTGSYSRKGTWTEMGQDGEAKEHNGVRTLQQRRYALSAEYKTNDWTLRSEYVHSSGLAFRKALVNTDDPSATDCSLGNLGDKAQGVYALVIAPIIKEKFHAKARYDMYQPTGDASKMKTQYEFGLDYEFNKNIEISGIYALVNDKSLAKDHHNYSLLDVQVSYKF